MGWFTNPGGDTSAATKCEPLTDSDLAAIEERASKAEPPPWRARRFEGIGDNTLVQPEMKFASWEFCCAARSDVPRLCETIRSLQLDLETASRGWQATNDRAEKQAARIAQLESDLARVTAEHAKCPVPVFNADCSLNDLVRTVIAEQRAGFEKPENTAEKP